MNMKLLAVVSPLSIYHGYSTWKEFWEGKFAPVNIKNVVVTILGSTGTSRMLRIALPWKYLWILVVCTR